MKIVDYLVQENDPNEYDKSLLHKPLFDVNMRLFRTSPFFRQLIMDIVNYMDAHLNMTFEDYAAPKGISGANLAIPYNIIGYKHQGKNKFCINPCIVRKSQDGFTTETNCGSLKLEKGIKVFRHAQIDLDYYDLKGMKCIEKNISRFEGGFIIQHEVDHNLGLCITDKELK
jgi:peptide deformylase